MKNYVYTYGYDMSKETYIQRMERVNKEYNGIFKFAKEQRQYWEKKRQDDNYSISTNKSRSSFEWRRLPRGLFGRWRLFGLPDKTEGSVRDTK